MRTFAYDPEYDNDLSLRERDGELVISVGNDAAEMETGLRSISISEQHWYTYLSPDEADRIALELHRRAEIVRRIHG